MTTNDVPNRKFTVVIPTRDRADTLIYAIKSALAQDYEDFSVLVSDNASVDNTPDVVTSIRDERLALRAYRQRLSMSHNWEFALSHVPDGWVTSLATTTEFFPEPSNGSATLQMKPSTHAIRANGCRYQWPALRGANTARLPWIWVEGIER